MRALILAAALFGATPLAAQVLTVYAPDYFTSEWGPGPRIEEIYEARCDCDLVFKPGDLLPRLMLEGSRSEADVVIGLTGDLLKKARESGLFASHDIDLSSLTLPVSWEDGIFVPFNYSHTAFVHDTARSDAPASFDALLDAPEDLRIVIQDPRSSASGLALALWVHAIYGDEAETAWARLAPKIVTVTKGWSESYGLFTSGEADMVLSYTTSPAYHLIAENDATKRAAIFPEGHYFLVEAAGRLASSDQPDLAKDFLAFLLDREFQSMIGTANWSLPAALERKDWPEGFQALDWPEHVLSYSEEEAASMRDEAIEAWRAGMMR